MSEPDWVWKSGEMTIGQARYELDEKMNLCCGDPESVADIILRLLECYDEVGDVKKMRVVLGNQDEVVWFFLYQFEAAGWINHGSCLPGWLEPLGEALRDTVGKNGVEEILAGSLDLNTGEIFEW